MINYDYLYSHKKILFFDYYAQYRFIVKIFSMSLSLNKDSVIRMIKYSRNFKYLSIYYFEYIFLLLK